MRFCAKCSHPETNHARALGGGDGWCAASDCVCSEFHPFHDQKEKTMDSPEMKPKEVIEQFRQTLLHNAAAAVLENMTSDAMRQVVDAVLKEALADIAKGSRYDPLGRIIHEKAEKYLREYLETPSAAAQIRVAVETGVKNVMGRLTEDVQKEVVDTAIKGMVTGFHNKSRGY